MIYPVKTTFHCTDCGHEFKGYHVEWQATAFAMPLECPKCHSIRTRPSSIFGWLSNLAYKPIWDAMESDRKQSEVNNQIKADKK